MHEAEHDWLDDLAASVADGQVIDWAALESTTDDAGKREIIRRLRAVAAIGQAHAELTFSDTSSDSLSVRSQLPGSDDSSVPTHWGPLRILERVGRGRFGDVYRAWDPSLDREVALKLLRRREGDSKSADSEVIEEGRLMARLRHSNIVTIYGALRIDGRTGLWMEFVEGRTLEAELKDRGPFPAADIIQVGTELCRALSAVHEAGLVHRDVKAQNVLRERGGRIVLGDFGTSYDLADGQPGQQDLAGTPAYIAPEVLRGEAATSQSDTYSLGVLLFHLATGSYPVNGRTVREIRSAHERGDSASLAVCRPDLNGPLASVIERALHPEQSSRFDGADALRAAFEACTVVPESESTPPRYRLRAAGIAAVVVIATAASFAAGLWQRYERQRSSVSGDVAAVAPVQMPKPPDSTAGPAPSGAVSWLAQTVSDYLHVGNIVMARSYAAAVPRPADDSGIGGRYWRLGFEARAAWQELNAQGSLDAVDAIASSTDVSRVALPSMYLALGRLKQAEQNAAVLPSITAGTPSPASREAMLAMVLQHSADRTRLRELLLTAPSSALMLNFGMLIRAGLLDQAEDTIRRMHQLSGGKTTLDTQLGEALIALDRGAPARAIEILKDAVPRRTSETFPFNVNNALARVRALAWEALGDPARGIEGLKEVEVQRHAVAGSTSVGHWLEDRALLARLYRAAGREGEARPIEEELRKLLAVADTDHPIVRQLAMTPR